VHFSGYAHSELEHRPCKHHKIDTYAPVQIRHPLEQVEGVPVLATIRIGAFCVAHNKARQHVGYPNAYMFMRTNKTQGGLLAKAIIRMWCEAKDV